MDGPWFMENGLDRVISRLRFYLFASAARAPVRRTGRRRRSSEPFPTIGIGAPINEISYVHMVALGVYMLI